VQSVHTIATAQEDRKVPTYDELIENWVSWRTKLIETEPISIMYESKGEMEKSLGANFAIHEVYFAKGYYAWTIEWDIMASITDDLKQNLHRFVAGFIRSDRGPKYAQFFKDSKDSNFVLAEIKDELVYATEREKVESYNGACLIHLPPGVLGSSSYGTLDVQSNGRSGPQLLDHRRANPR
jgi:hypothetical protein